MSDIGIATRNLNISIVKRLLKEDTKGELIKTVDSAGRTLVDIAICCGKRTHRSQVPLVKMLTEQGAKFTLVWDKRLYKTYCEIINTINLQNKTRK